MLTAGSAPSHVREGDSREFARRKAVDASAVIDGPHVAGRGGNLDDRAPKLRC